MYIVSTVLKTLMKSLNQGTNNDPDPFYSKVLTNNSYVIM